MGDDRYGAANVYHMHKYCINWCRCMHSLCMPGMPCMRSRAEIEPAPCLWTSLLCKVGRFQLTAIPTGTSKTGTRAERHKVLVSTQSVWAARLNTPASSRSALAFQPAHARTGAPTQYDTPTLTGAPQFNLSASPRHLLQQTLLLSLLLSPCSALAAMQGS
eukprot:1091137-Pelagomonas_calceolata.AAC.1